MLYLAGGPLDGRNPHEAVRQELAELYKAVTGEKMPALIRAPGGKPRFSAGPLHCSLTHTRRAAFCALSDRPLGLDAEPLDRTISPAVADKLLLPEELAQYRQAAEPGLCLLSFWVLKEAYVKYTGQGLPGLMGAGPFSLDPPAGPQGLHFTRLTHDGHLLALCSPLGQAPRLL